MRSSLPLPLLPPSLLSTQDPTLQLPPSPVGLWEKAFVSATGQAACLFVLQPVVLLAHPHGNSPGSPALSWPLLDA